MNPMTWRDVQLRAAADPDFLLTTDEVATLFRVDIKTVSRWALGGRIPSLRTFGGHHRFRASDILPLLHPEGGAS